MKFTRSFQHNFLNMWNFIFMRTASYSHDLKWLLDSSDKLINSFNRLLYCMDWIALKIQRSKIFKFGKFGGWDIKQISNSSCVVARRNYLLSWSMCVLALSCWIKIGRFESFVGHSSLIEGKMFSIIKYDLVISFSPKLLVSFLVYPQLYWHYFS